MESIDADEILKEKIVDVAEGNSQENSHGSKSDESTSAQRKIVVSPNKKQKRRNESTADDDVTSSKKPKIQDAKSDNSTMEACNIKVEKNNEKIAFVERSTATPKQNKKKEKKKLQINKMKNRKHQPNSESVQQLMSLDTARLKTYGLNAKKFKNKLKYGNRKI